MMGLKFCAFSISDNLDENKKRRLVIGIAINSVLPPTMRNYVSGKLGLLSETFKLNRHTDIQIYPFHPKSYLTTHQTYEVIDGNKDLGLGQQGQFICLVEDAVGRYRLFLIPHIAHNISFDSCDLPSLLEIIIRKCPAAIQIFVKRVC